MGEGEGISLVDMYGDAQWPKGALFVILGISMGGFLSQTQCAQFAKLGVFWKI